MRTTHLYRNEIIMKKHIVTALAAFGAFTLSMMTLDKINKFLDSK